MRRKLLNIATVASLMLCLASGAVWIVGYYAPAPLFSVSRVKVLAWPVSLHVQFVDGNRGRAMVPDLDLGQIPALFSNQVSAAVVASNSTARPCSRRGCIGKSTACRRAST